MCRAKRKHATACRIRVDFGKRGEAVPCGRDKERFFDGAEVFSNVCVVLLRV